MTADDRPLDVRLTEYRDSLRGTIPQLKAIEARLPARADVALLRDAQRFFGIVADDITRVLDGERLAPFRIDGVIPK